MDAIARLSVGPAALPPGGAVLAATDADVVFDRAFPHDDPMEVYLWVDESDRATVADGLQTAPVDTFEVVDSADGSTLLRVAATPRSPGFFRALAEFDASVLTAQSDDGAWTVHAQFDDVADVFDFCSHCTDCGVDVDLHRVRPPGVTASAPLGTLLTERQRETLCTAVDEGYFEVPRRANLDDLATVFDVSSTAVSQRLRRGLDTVLSVTLVPDSSTDPED